MNPEENPEGLDRTTWLRRSGAAKAAQLLAVRKNCDGLAVPIIDAPTTDTTQED